MVCSAWVGAGSDTTVNALAVTTQELSQSALGLSGTDISDISLSTDSAAASATPDDSASPAPSPESEGEDATVAPAG